MWKKMQRPGRGKDSAIGRPQLIETTFNERDLAAYPDVPTLADANAFAQSTFAPSAVVQPVPPPRSSSRAAPVVNPGRNSKAISMAQSVSSVYSQPTPHMSYAWQENAALDVAQPQQIGGLSRNGADEPDISPPSSAGAQDESASRPVSPVDPNFTRPITNAKPSHPHASQIPIARKPPPAINKFAQAVAAMKMQGTVTPAPSGASKMRWDEYSGEPSFSGKPSQVIPGSQSYAPQYPSNAPARKVLETRTHNPLPVTRSTGRSGAKDLTIDTQPREEWKGASGRSAIVPVPSDRVGSRPLYQAPREKAASPAPTPTPTAAFPHGGIRALASDDVTDDETIKPVVPLKVGRNTPPRTLTSPVAANFSNSQSVIRETAVEVPWDRKTRAVPSTPPEDTPLASHQPTQSVGSESSANKWTRPDATTTSRFSWTTYATSTTGQQSPPPSPPPPLPTDTMLHEAQKGKVPLALSSHPSLPRSPKSPLIISRKPKGPRTYGYSYPSPTNPPSPASLVTKALPLPPPPSQTQSQELTTALQEQLDNLKMQKRNLQRVVRELRKDKGTMANPLLTDFRKARETELRAKEIDEEIADLTRQEHDVGLRLHRAWKRREKEDGNSIPSALWIRRVTEVAQ